LIGSSSGTPWANSALRIEIVGWALGFRRRRRETIYAIGAAKDRRCRTKIDAKLWQTISRRKKPRALADAPNRLDTTMGF
jgi:hypothetical protein